MAETTSATRREAVAGPDRPLGAARAFLLLAGAWSRAAWQYRGSLAMLTAGQFLVASLDGVAILLLFAHTTDFAGFTLPQVLFLYGTTRTSFAIADLVASGAEFLGEMVRTGEFDVMLIRPVATLPQVLATNFTPKRFGRLAQSLAVLVVALVLLPVAWTPAKAGMVALMILCGAVIYCALWVLAGAFIFVAADAGDLVNSFTYGGEFLTEYPLTTYGRPLAYTLLFAVPLAFVNWEPALFVLGLPDPFGLPYALRFAAPVAAALLAAVAGLAWRGAVRRYRSTGS